MSMQGTREVGTKREPRVERERVGIFKLKSLALSDSLWFKTRRHWVRTRCRLQPTEGYFSLKW